MYTTKSSSNKNIMNYYDKQSKKRSEISHLIISFIIENMCKIFAIFSFNVSFCIIFAAKIPSNYSGILIFNRINT